jgi:hypothetical protein
MAQNRLVTAMVVGKADRAREVFLHEGLEGETENE